MEWLHFPNLITGLEDPFRSGRNLISTCYKTLEEGTGYYFYFLPSQLCLPLLLMLTLHGLLPDLS